MIFVAVVLSFVFASAGLFLPFKGYLSGFLALMLAVVLYALLSKIADKLRKKPSIRQKRIDGQVATCEKKQ